ncbi:Z-ring formation inhibitor MciZ [Paenibacillus mesophilus]|uniref:Z-ring formation inhibitor MciZ n=1 Tax=Paenibacillus mesophilus TaxID=2582849 RepID=UPI00110D7DBA|nr:Z-ring formation inhibitor MciZ [Paenibacillus mesophilus]
MKSYVTEKQIRMVGKGWEIREQLRKMSGVAGSGPSELAALLPTLIHTPERAKPQSAPQRIPPYRTKDRRVIPFPSS